MYDLIFNNHKEIVNVEPIKINGETIEIVQKFKRLGVIIQKDLQMRENVEYDGKKVAKKTGFF